MLKILTASTREIDDTEAAIAEITEQLGGGNNLLAHSIGLVSCYSDFIDSGVIAAMKDALPFEFLGTTTLGTVTKDSSSLIQLTVMVLTSDDVSFVTGLTEPILDENADVIAKGYADAMKKSGISQRPSLMFSYAPLLVNVGGDFFVNTLSEASDGVPNFGTIISDDSIDYRNSRVIFNGEAYTDRLAFVLVCGDVKPKFRLASISKEKIFREKGVVTSSEGNQLREINDTPVGDYLQSVGLTKDEDGVIVGINSYPFIVDYNDGTAPVVRVMFAITPEGYAVCGGDIPQGATLSVGSIDGNEVVKATGDEIKDILANEKPNALLIFSCIGRYFSLGYESGREVEEVKRLLDGQGIPYAFTYSGGEICPTSDAERDDATTNRFHNDTLAVCVF
jgi:hypothetical protein